MQRSWVHVADSEAAAAGGRREAVTVRDLWQHTDIGAEPKLPQPSAKDLAAEGGHLMLLLTPQTE